MRSPAPDSYTIDTLGKLADNGMSLIWYCYICSRKMALTTERMIEKKAPGQMVIRWQPPIKCSACGSRNVSVRVQAKVPGRSGTVTGSTIP